MGAEMCGDESVITLFVDAIEASYIVCAGICLRVARIVYFFGFRLRPDFKVPLNLRARSISAFVQCLTTIPPTFTGSGATMCPSAIHI